MSTYGTKEGNYFKADKNNKFGKNLQSVQYSLVIDSESSTTPGKITIYSSVPDNPNSIIEVGTIPRGETFLGSSAASSTELQYFNQPNIIKGVKEQAKITTEKSLYDLGVTDYQQRSSQANNLINGQAQTATAPVVDPLAPKDDQGTATSDQAREALDVASLNVSGEIPDSTKIRDNYGNWFYPFEISSNKQDRIQFTMKRNIGSEFNLSLKGDLVSRKNPTQTIEGSVTLAVQPSITDSNSVDWGGSNLNPLQALAAGASMKLQGDQQIGSSALPIAQEIAKALKGNEYGFGEFFKIYLAGEAASVQNLLSRATGAVVNPNLELLFNGPQLRPFNFTFRLSPRDSTEASHVKQIIRFFKQGMAIKTSASDVFLKSPNLFDIRYLVDDTINEHPSIGRIKTCALIGCDVDYTPDGSYMTFSDTDRTMTSYQLSLRFSEVDPVYESDYYDSTRPLKDYEIGY
jgi:hypothetical protein